MTHADLYRILGRLRSVYPTTTVQHEAIDVYHEHLAKFDSQIVDAAASRHISTEKWFPTVSELVAASMDIRREQAEERSQQQVRIDYQTSNPATNEEYAEIKQNIARLFRSVDEGPPPAPTLAARSCHKAWHDALGPELAEARLRKHYPDQADEILAESKALLDG